MRNLMGKYYKEFRPNMKKELSLKNIHEVPRITKVVVSSGIGRYKEDEEIIKKFTNDFSIFCGQKPKINLSKKAVSAFKLRIGQPIGLTATLRGQRMYDFIERLTKVGMPRIRDFKGIRRKGFDKMGNHCFGVEEHTIMPEIKYDNVNQSFGFQVNIHTNTTDVKTSEILLKNLGFPFEKS